MINKNKLERKVPCISFIIPLNLRFSVALDWKTSEIFKNIVRNNNEEISKVMINFIFKRLKIKDLNMKEFEKYMFNYIEQAKKQIYTDLSLNSGSKPNEKTFCKLMLKDIDNFISENVE